MMGFVLAWAHENWGEWFGQPAGGPLKGSLLAGGPAHRERFSAFLFAEGESSPSVYMKVGRGDVESARVEREASTVLRLSAVGLDPGAVGIPGVYGTVRNGDAFAAAYSVVPGRRLLVPSMMSLPTFFGRQAMRMFWSQTGNLGAQLSQLPSNGSAITTQRLGDRIAEYCRQFDVSGTDLKAIEALRADVESAEGRWLGCWQHGDMAVGNVLVERGMIRLLDWEAASDDYEPWFDLATAPIAAVILARRQSGCSIRKAAEHVLAPASWTGLEIRSVFARLWTHSIPPGSAIVLTAMRMALRRSREKRAMHDDYAEFARLACTNTSVGGLVQSIEGTG